MTRATFLKSLAVLVLLAAGSSSPVLAQTIGGQNPGGPAVSPYLNLVRPGTLPGINYYNLVQPQMQFQSAISNLQQNQSSLVQAVTTGGVTADTAVVTGHAATFGNYSHYFPIPSTSGGAFGGVGMLPGQRNLQNQRRTYSPLMGLGGVGYGSGLGGFSSGTNPSVSPTRPR